MAVVVAVMAVFLSFTLPSTGQNIYTVEPSPWQDPADSIRVECSGGPTIRGLQTARLYWYPVSGGGWRLQDEHPVYGREGGPDSFQVSIAGHYYVTTTNQVGESCASGLVYVPDFSITGVEPDKPITLGRVSRTQLFDARGRIVRGTPRASGVYFRKIWYESGRSRIERVVILK